MPKVDQAVRSLREKHLWQDHESCHEALVLQELMIFFAGKMNTKKRKRWQNIAYGRSS